MNCFLLGEEFEYIDPAHEEMDDGFVFSPVSMVMFSVQVLASSRKLA